MADDNHFLDLNVAIYSRLKDNWVSGSDPVLPIVLDNDDARGKDLTSGFVQLEINVSDSNFASINHNNPKIRTTGVISFNIHTLQNKGVGLGLVYAGQIATHFRGANFSDVLCFAPSILSAQEKDYAKGKFWLTPLICPFWYDKHVTIS